MRAVRGLSRVLGVRTSPPAVALTQSLLPRPSPHLSAVIPTILWLSSHSLSLPRCHFSSSPTAAPTPARDALPTPPTPSPPPPSPSPTSSSAPMSITPHLHVVFTCTQCETRNQRRLSRQAYNEGVVLVRCDGCRKLHLFADHLGWFGDQRQTIEDIMREKGMEVTKVQGVGVAAEAGQKGQVLALEGESQGEDVQVADHDGVVEIVRGAGAREAKTGSAERG